jgi:hypothetical protein
MAATTSSNGNANLLLERAPTSAPQTKAPNGAEGLLRDLSDLCGSFVANDGSKVAWRGEQSAVPCIRIAVTPARPGHSVSLDLRLADGPIIALAATPDWGAPSPGERLYRAVLPQPLAGAWEALPVLRFAGQPVSPRMSDRPAAAPAKEPPPFPVWDWTTRFLASLSATVKRQEVGEGPDGLRIDWLIDEGRFFGPHIEGVVLPGAADFMRVRRDGVAIVDVRACLETTTGARIFVAYGGTLDLGADGYRRALRGEFATLPPLVVTPTFETADPRLAWLNRVRCFGVGRVDTQALTYVFDVYAVEVGERHAGGVYSGGPADHLRRNR